MKLIRSKVTSRTLQVRYLFIGARSVLGTLAPIDARPAPFSSEDSCFDLEVPIHSLRPQLTLSGSSAEQRNAWMSYVTDGLTSKTRESSRILCRPTVQRDAGNTYRSRIARSIKDAAYQPNDAGTMWRTQDVEMENTGPCTHLRTQKAGRGPSGVRHARISSSVKGACVLCQLSDPKLNCQSVLRDP